MQDFCLTDKKPISYTTTPAKCADLRHGHEVQLDIESLDGDTKFGLDNVLKTRNHPFSSRQIATNEDFKRWSYLGELPETGDKRINSNFDKQRSPRPDRRAAKKERR